jgi:DNA segregation ATPase FtsK/SpoIIIE, S-DNA-T family
MFIVGITLKSSEVSKDVLLELDSNAQWASAIPTLSQSLADIDDSSYFVLERTGEILRSDTPLRSLDLRWGDEVRIESGNTPGAESVRRFVPAPGSPLDAIFISEGVAFVGREAATSTHVIPDSSVSRRHAQITSTPSSVTITDLGSSNGTSINGKDISSAVALRPGDEVAFGRARYVFSDGSDHIATDGRSAFEGIIPFNRPPRVVDPVPATKISLPAPPVKVEPRKLPLATYLAPLVGAGVSAAVSHRPITLLIALVSPLMYLFTNFNDKKSGAKKYAAEAKDFKAAVDANDLSGRQLLDTYREWAERRWPRAAQLAGLIQTLDEGLWWRRPIDDDFLQVRLGSYDRISPIEVAVATGGADELQKYATDKFAVISKPQKLPLPLSLKDVGGLGIVGNAEWTVSYLKSLLIQVAGEHSHRDVAIDIVAPDGADYFDDLKWLPHVVGRGVDASLVAFDDDSEPGFFQKLRAIKDDRLSKDSFGRDTLNKSPHHLVVICPPITTNRAQISEFLTNVADANMSVIWIATERGMLPGECSTVISLASPEKGEVSSVRLSTTFDTELIDTREFESLGRHLSPLRDTSASESGAGIPDGIALLDLPSLSNSEIDKVLSTWKLPRPDMSFPLGVSEDGEFTLSIVKDGPHGLVAGMTGAGKSELLQTMIASLALSYSPELVNFVLIDYKGGSSFRSCKLLPHTVGFVTDLDEGLAERAITSLNAELRRREHLITGDGGAKDIIEYRQLHPDAPIPSVLIVIDEFAFLVKEIPVFVERLVDVAQRGRSLGVHLILATQRPSGVISPQIQANTNLRIALRVASASDSSDVIDNPIASTILPAQRGRAYIKTGPKKPVEVQAAYAGRIAAEHQSDTGRAMTFAISKLDLRSMQIAGDVNASDPSDLDKVVALCQEAVTRANIAPARSPWLEPLPAAVSLDHVIGLAAPTDHPIGLIDIPDEQSRAVLTYEPTRDQNIAIVGASGTGKTNLLLNIATSLSHDGIDASPWMYGIDFGHSGLASLASLPTWGGTGTANSPESVARTIDILDALSAQRQAVDPSLRDSLKPIVTFVDNWSGLINGFQKLELLPYLDRLTRLIADGRGIKMYFILTAEREGVISSTVSSAVDNVWSFRLASSQDVGTRNREHAGRLLSLPVGRVMLTNGNEAQVVFPCPPAPVAAAPLPVGISLPGQQPYVRLLPDSFPAAGLGNATDLRTVPLGIDEMWNAVALDVLSNPYFLAVGNPRTGKSTALTTITSALWSTGHIDSSYLVGGRRTSLATLPSWSQSAMGADDARGVLDAVKNDLTANKRVLLVLDDADDFADISSSLNPVLDNLLKFGLDHQLLVLCAVSVNRAQRTFSSWLGALKTQQHGLLLGGNPDNSDIFQIRLPRPINSNEPPGRGFLVTPRGNRKIHVAS